MRVEVGVWVSEKRWVSCVQVSAPRQLRVDSELLDVDVEVDVYKHTNKKPITSNFPLIASPIEYFGAIQRVRSEKTGQVC